jgi:hypothetical protein
MNPLPLRPGEAQDVEAIVRLVNAAFMAERPFIKGDRINAEGVEEMLARGTFLLAEQGGVLVACVFVNPQGERAHLMAAGEVYCRTAGYCEMELRFINHRTELSRFYQKMGYAETGVTEQLPDQTRVKVPFHFVQMCKRLA